MTHWRRGIIRRHGSELEVLERAADGALAAGMLYVVCWYVGVRHLGAYHLLAALSLALLPLFADATGLYRAERGIDLREELVPFVEAWAGVLLALVLVLFTTKTSAFYSRKVILFWFLSVLLVWVVLRTGRRLALREARRRGYNLRRAAIAGYTGMGHNVGTTIAENPQIGLDLLGFFDDRDPRRLDPPPEGLPSLRGKLGDLVALAQKGRVDIVYIALSLKAEDRIKELIRKLADTTVSVYLVPDFLIYDLLHAEWTSLEGLPTVSIVETPFSGVDGLLKRFEDMGLGFALFVVLLAPMAIIALLVKLVDGGPVLFKQRRYGLDGKEIVIWKFRTMRVAEDGDDLVQASRHDPRTTRLGALLRRTSLDELPQFFNVVQGQMSIVGPRPHPVALNEQYRGLVYRYMLRHKVKPGITGLAQINGFRGETDTLESMEKRVQYDLEYIRNWSLLLDLKIIAITTIRGFTGTHAY